MQPISEELYKNLVKSMQPISEELYKNLVKCTEK